LSARITSDIGTPDVLINNAGAGGWLPFDVTTVEEAGTMLAVPYLAAFAITHAFLPDMIARGSGSAVFISSPLSYLAWPNASAYTASRRALTGLAETLQTERCTRLRASPMTIAALTRSGARKASEVVMLIFRALQFSRLSALAVGSAMSSPNQRRPLLCS
jgi:short-subunit dehydrogenase